MPKKQAPLVIDQSQGFVMTAEGLLIPGKFLRKMGGTISVAFSPRLIVISSDGSSAPTRKSEQRSKTLSTNRGGKVSRKAAERENKNRTKARGRREIL